MIVAHVLTDATVDDPIVGVALIGAAPGDIASVTADAAYDTVAFYEAASAGRAQVVVPPITRRLRSRRPAADEASRGSPKQLALDTRNH